MELQALITSIAYDLSDMLDSQYDARVQVSVIGDDSRLAVVYLTPGTTDPVPLDDATKNTFNAEQGRLADLFRKLRDEMYQPNVGTWYTAEFDFSRENFTMAFDFDGQPPFFTPAHFTYDFDRYPRDLAHMPVWLKAILDKR